MTPDTRTETEKRLYEMAQAYLSGVRTSDAFALDIITTVRDRCAPPKPRKVEGWVNQYDGLQQTFHLTKDDADDYARRLRNSFRRTACIYVSGEEGKGPE